MSTMPTITVPTSADIARKQEGGRQTGSSCVKREGIFENVLLGFGIKFGCSNLDLAVEIRAGSISIFLNRYDIDTIF
jgi:hypothetical protein